MTGPMRARRDGLVDQLDRPLVVSLLMGEDPEQVDRGVFRIKLDHPAIEGTCLLEMSCQVKRDCTRREVAAGIGRARELG